MYIPPVGDSVGFIFNSNIYYAPPNAAALVIDFSYIAPISELNKSPFGSFLSLC